MDQLRSSLDHSLGAGYRIERELGGGGMSRVFVAVDVRLDRQVVVKVLAPERYGSIDAERFAREIRLAARLQEPHIVPVLSDGVTNDGIPYFIMPFVRGASLRERITAGPVPYAQSIEILRDIARALAFAHQHGVVHRDIKPENVLLHEGTAVVSDFGIARAVSAATATGHTGPAEGLTAVGMSLGTPAYMSPEQAAGDEVDHRADLYAWGVIAYELLAGVHPFGGKTTAQQLIAAHIAEQPSPLAERLPAALASQSHVRSITLLVMRCLAKRPEDRPESAAELVTALAPETNSNGSRRSRRAMAVVAGIAAITVAGFAYAIAHRRVPAAVDSGIVAVFPFRVAAAEPSLQYLREGMLDLLVAKLGDRPRALDPRAVLAPWRRAGGSERTDPEPDLAMAVAAGLGAGLILEGEVAGGAARATLSARLLAVPDGHERARASVAGSAANLPVLIDSLVAELLLLDAGERQTSATALGGIPLPALRAYLDGQMKMRTGEYERAADDYARALDIDSTFALAAVRLSRATDWAEDQRGAPARALAVRYRDRLSARDKWLVPSGDPRTRSTTVAAAIQKAERAVTAVPDMPELWYDLGDTYNHWGPLLGVPDVQRRAARAFERALALDSTFHPALEHLPSLYRSLGDSAAERRSAALSSRGPTGDSWPLWRYWLARTPEERQAAAAQLRRGPIGNELIAAGGGAPTVDWTAENTALLRDAEQRAATPMERGQLATTEYFVAMNRGQPSRGARLYSEGIANRFPATMLDAEFWDGDSASGRSHLAALERLTVSPLPPAGAERDRWVDATFLVAQETLARRDTMRAHEAVRALLAVPAIDTLPLQSETPRRYALLLDAQIATLAHRRDADARLASLDSLLRLGPIGLTLTSIGNLVASRLWEQHGDVPRAFAALQRVSHGPDPALFFSTYLREGARLAATLGDRNTAIRYYHRYLDERSEAEPALAAHLRGVREELRRLERAGPEK